MATVSEPLVIFSKWYRQTLTGQSGHCQSRALEGHCWARHEPFICRIPGKTGKSVGGPGKVLFATLWRDLSVF